MRERDIEAYLVRQARAAGGEVRKVQWIGRHGAPDRLLMLPVGIRAGRYGGVRTIWVELKAPGKKASAQQQREHTRMATMGQIVVVIDSIDGVNALLA